MARQEKNTGAFNLSESDYKVCDKCNDIIYQTEESFKSENDSRDTLCECCHKEEEKENDRLAEIESNN